MSADEVLFDLYDLAPVGAARALEHTVELRPGDGRIFYCGPQAAGEAVSAAVHGKHYENERAIYEMDAELAAANGLDIANAAGAANQGARAHAAGDHIKAHAEILEAQKALAAGIAADVTLGSALDQLQKALELLSEVAGTYRESFDTVAPPEGRESATRYKPWKNDQDPKMQQYVDETAACFCARLKLEDRMYAGEAAAAGPELAQLLEASQRLHDEAIPYVLSRKQ